MKIVKTLHYLLQNSKLFQNPNIHIDETWITKLSTSNGTETCYLDNDFCNKYNIDEEKCINNQVDNEEQW